MPTPVPGSDPASVVQRYYDAINARDYPTAWALGGNHLSGSYAAFVSGFADLAADTLVVDSVSGNTVTMELHAQHIDGSTADFAGSYTVENGVIARAAVHAVGSGNSSPSPAVPAAPGGMLNPAVTQATIGSTICVSGWTATIRPSSSFTKQLKEAQLAASDLADKNPAHYEEDHIVPLELGGAPLNAENLRPVPLARAQSDDGLERSLHNAVCDGRLTLDAARQQIIQAKTGEG